MERWGQMEGWAGQLVKTSAAQCSLNKVAFFLFSGCGLRAGARHRQDGQVHADRALEEQRKAARAARASIEGETPRGQFKSSAIQSDYAIKLLPVRPIAPVGEQEEENAN